MIIDGEIDSVRGYKMHTPHRLNKKAGMVRVYWTVHDSIRFLNM